MFSRKTRKSPKATGTDEHVRTLRHTNDYSTWRTLREYPGDETRKIIKDDDSGQLCFERRSTRKHSTRSEPPKSYTQGGGLPFVPERTQVAPLSSSRSRRGESISFATRTPTKIDHAPPTLGEMPSSRQSSSTRSTRAPAIPEGPKEEPTDEADIRTEAKEESEDDENVEVIDVMKEGEGGDGSGTLVEETEVAPVSVAGES